MSAFLYLLGSVTFVSLLSLVGILSLLVGKNRLQSFLIISVAFASGTLLAVSFLHMIPETYSEIGTETSSMVLIGILLFFFIENFIHWHHCGEEECHVHPMAYVNIISDGIHNFTDGIALAAAYLTSIPIGLMATFAISLHEIPQEFGDFSVLIHSGLSTKKALAYNLLSALTAIIGAIVGFMFLAKIEQVVPHVLAIAAGGFIYIATTDLMPQLHKGRTVKNLAMQSLALLAGILVLALAFHLTPE